MRRLVMLLLCISCVLADAVAQIRTITGRIIDDRGNAVPNASITVKNSNVGTTASADGNFTLRLPATAKTLVVSAVGLGQQEVPITSGGTYNVTLSATSANLSEVVVTALGIARDKRSLGYATQNVKGEDLIKGGEVNIVSALQGKVAGVNITNTSGSAGASVNINIRGISSFTGSNQPLFVIDGIPVSNEVDRTNGGPNGTLGDAQPANRALDIDMNQVESVNILKGPAAAALYGSRASAGAIMITTKKGSSARGRTEVIVNSSYSFQEAFGLPKVQNTYGQGASGVYNPTSNNSYGPAFGATPTVANGLIIGGTAVTNYRAYPNNINDFFRRGTSAENSVTINGGDANRNQTLSLGNVTQNGILYNTFLKRTSLRFGANSTLGERMKVGGSVTYTNTVQQGVLGGNNSALSTVLGLGRSIDLTSYRDSGNYKTITGANNFLLPNTDNPYFDAFENPTTSNLNRFIGNVNVGYDATKWLNISYRLGGDLYFDRRKQIFSITTGRVPAGAIRDELFFRSEINGDLILRATKKDFLANDLTLTAIVGQNINQKRFQNIVVQGDQLSSTGFYNVSNGSVFTVGSLEQTTLRRLLGYYAQATFGYKNYAFLELTGRTDKSSTLPTSKNTYFYPSVNASLVLTDALKVKSNTLSYAKIRASWTRVGKDADPYLLYNTYSSRSFGNNVASFTFPLGATGGFGATSRLSDTIPLSPEFTSNYELGLNLQFFKGRITIDAAYYNGAFKSQILDLTVAPSSGYRTYTTNVGKMTNKGIELSVSGSPLKTRNFNWDITANYTRQRNLVEQIAEGVDNSQIPGNAFTGSIPSFKVGYPYGVIIGGTIPRSPDGQRIINPSTGTYMPTEAGNVLADPNPDYQLGIVNNFSYKNFSLDFTFDFTKGGQVLSFTAATYKSRGALDITAVDREQPHILPGVIADGTGKYYPNNIQISGQTYWSTALGGLQSEFNVYDATVLKLREVAFGYNLPNIGRGKVKISGLRFGVFARNVFYVAPNSPIDPQLNTQGAGNIRGLDLQGAPNARSIGANLKLTL